jgi:hypothetical protein
MWRRFVIPLNLSFLVGRVERRMSPDDIFKAKDPDLIQSMAAMKRAALEARKIAIRTGTSIIVRDNGRIIRRSAKELERDRARSSRIKHYDHLSVWVMFSLTTSS